MNDENTNDNLDYSGLSYDEVKKRIKQGKINYDTSVKTKSIKDIVKTNLFTLFNLLNFVLALAIILVKSYKNLLFLGVVISNTIISTIQEINAKRTIDKLSLIAQSKVKVIRNGKEEKIGINDIVIDDIVKLSTGNQVVVDSVILDGECEVNESFITGESESVFKRKGDTILSGSFIASGSVITKVIHVGLDNYASKISKEASYIKKANSEILKSLNLVIKYISFAIIPISLLLFNNQMHIKDNTLQNAVINTVAALIGMIPEGLILLTSTVFAVSVIRLSKYNVLVQQLYCSETLSRVDTLCLDKTGTITEGVMEVIDIIPINKTSEKEINDSLCAFCSKLDDNNETFKAIHNVFNIYIDWRVKKTVPFSSSRKYSLVEFQDKGTYILGAPEIILRNSSKKLSEQVNKLSNENRVIMLAHSDSSITRKNLPKDIKPIAIIVLQDKIRKSARKTLEYFKEQDVDIKIISGDNVNTVYNIAKRVGLNKAEKYIDARNLLTYEEIKGAVDKYTIFGRVSPSQKKGNSTCFKRSWAYCRNDR